MIYVMCPANFATGGTELAHQFARTLIDKGAEASMLYVGKDLASPVPERFLKYAVPYTIDSRSVAAHDVVVFPETLASKVDDFPKARKYIWWMSVDNFFVAEEKRRPKGKVRRWFWTVTKRGTPGYYAKKNVFHLCQSYYAADFLAKNGIDNPLMLSDFLGDEFFIKGAVSVRENIVAYNPKKGMEFTALLQKDNPDIRFVAIENMTPAEISELFRKAKVYIDFGHHPGKDRLPREAAINGCCVVTGRDGAAGFQQDLPIPDACKIDKVPENVSRIGDVIRDIFDNFVTWSSGFSGYVDFIRDEKRIFLAQVDEFMLHVNPGSSDSRNV